MYVKAYEIGFSHAARCARPDGVVEYLQTNKAEIPYVIADDFDGGEVKKTGLTLSKSLTTTSTRSGATDGSVRAGRKRPR